MPARHLYQQTILDHYKNPRGFGEIQEPCRRQMRENPVCGDRVEIFLLFSGAGKIEEARFTGRGCALCLASASMMVELIQGRELNEVMEAAEIVRSVFSGNAPAGRLEELGTIGVLQAVLEFPVRIKCVLLAWEALRDLLAGHQSAS